MFVGVLGPVEGRSDAGPLDLGTRKQRALLAALVLHEGRAAATDVLVDLLWGEAPPPSVGVTLQGYVARLRRALEPERAPRTAARVLVSEQPGYALRLAPDALDVRRFERVVTAPRPTAAASGAALEARLADLDAALDLWRGTPYTELGDAFVARTERARLEELRLVALEERAATELSLGRHTTAAAGLESLTAAHPLREALWRLRVLALVRGGRQAEALEVLAAVRRLLADELGLEPGPELRALHTAVLRQDPTLEWAAPAATPGPPPPTAPPPTPPAAGPAGTGTGPLPLVGRDTERRALLDLLTAGRRGAAFAVVTGEPGIGKSRLALELLTSARTAGVRAVVGRCSEDEGAPPLHPWASVLGALGRELPAAGSAGAFEAWEHTAKAVLDAAAGEPVVVVLEDLHWADPSTLRVLRLVAESASDERLLLVATWRHQPPPGDLLAAAAAALARRHALRVELSGLSTEEAGRVVAAVAEVEPTAEQARSVRSHTGGNPFFLVEYGHLARQRGDLSVLLAEERPPAAVQEVIARRVAVLPEATAALLGTAAVVGTHADLDTLAALGPPGAAGEDDVLGTLEPALAAGLLVEDGVDRFRFAHALVRDTLEGTMSRSRRARIHAEVAEVLGRVPGREGEVARHWLRSGPRHAHRAWPSALAAARAAEQVFAFTESAALLEEALEAVGSDPAAGPRERCDLLLALARALQRADDWVAMRHRVHEAAALAGELGDLDRLVAATTLPLDGALWQAVEHGKVDERMVAALRGALDRLPAGDSPARCRVMLALSAEIYYGSSPLEREALADEALGVARRLGDPRLVLWALVSVITSTWRGGNAQRRVELGAEAARLAEELGDRVARSSATTLQAVAAGELGDFEEMQRLVVVARDLADEVQHVYAHLVLDALVAPWLAMRGDEEALDATIAHAAGLAERMTLTQAADTVHGVALGKALWDEARRGLLDDLVGTVAGQSVLPVSTLVAALWARSGHPEKAAAFLDAHPEQVRRDLGMDIWFSPVVWAMAAEAGWRLGRRDLAAEAYASLLPLGGRPAAGGSGVIVGPVDAFLAMAAAATGEDELATRHLTAAAAQCREWDLPVAAAWVDRLRTELA